MFVLNSFLMSIVVPLSVYWWTARPSFEAFFFSSRLFAAIGPRSGSCFTGQLPGIGTVFILASQLGAKNGQPSCVQAHECHSSTWDWKVQGQGWKVETWLYTVVRERSLVVFLNHAKWVWKSKFLVTWDIRTVWTCHIATPLLRPPAHSTYTGMLMGKTMVVFGLREFRACRSAWRCNSSSSSMSRKVLRTINLGSCFTSSTRSWSPPKLLTSPSDKNFASTSSWTPGALDPPLARR